jgi:Ca-activated chloride channel family protein
MFRTLQPTTATAGSAAQDARPARSRMLWAQAVPLAILSLLLPPFAHAQSARSLVQQGNQAYESKNYKEALDAYEKAAEIEPDSPRIWFNKGDALYQQGEFEKALDAYEQAALRGDDPRIEALSKFNQGNASFRGGIERAQEDPKQALAGVERGVRFYQDALKLDPALNDARHNVEVARRAMKALREQMQNQPQQGGQKQDDQSEQQDPQEQLKDLIQQQQQAADQSKSLSQQQQSQGNSEQVRQQSESQADQQQKLGEQTQQLSDQMDSQSQQGSQQQGAQQAQQHVNNAAAKQQQAGQQLRDQQLADARPAKEAMMNSIKRSVLNGEQEDSVEQQQQQAAQPKPSPEVNRKRARRSRMPKTFARSAPIANTAEGDMARIRPAEKDR